jgi:hypothetical protein
MSTAATIHAERRIATPRNRIADATIVALPCNAIDEEEEEAPVTAGWFTRVLDKLQQLAQMSQGWDSYGAMPPERPMLLAAMELAESLAQIEWAEPSVVTATRSGGIQFEWGTHDTVYFELECISRDTAHYFFSDQRRAVEEEGAIHAGDLLDEVILYISRAHHG